MSSTSTHNFIDNRSMAFKLSIVPVIIITLLIIIGTLTYFSSNTITQVNHDIQQNAVPKVSLANDLLKVGLDSQALVAQYALSHNQDLISKLELLEKRADWIQDEFAHYTINPEQQTLLKNLEQNFTRYYQLLFQKLIPQLQQSETLMDQITHQITPKASLNLQNLRRYSPADIANQVTNAERHLLLSDKFIHLYYESQQESYFQRSLLELIAVRDALAEIGLQTLDAKQQVWLQEVSQALSQLESNFIQEQQALTQSHQILTQALPEITGRIADESARIQESIWQTMNGSLQDVNEKTDTLKQSNIVFVVSSILIAALLIWLITRRVTQTLDKLKSTIVTVQQQGDLSVQTHIRSTDEIGQMAQAFDQMLANQNTAIHEIKTVMAKVSEGQFNQTVTTDLVGHFDELKQSVNQTVGQIQTIFTELNQVNTALSEGDFSQTIRQSLQGEFEVAAQAVNHSVTLLNEFVQETNQVMQSLSQGDLTANLHLALPGELNEMKQAINHTIQTIAQAIQEVNQVAQAQAKGDLSQVVRSDYQGSFNELKQAVNTSGEALSRIVATVQHSADSLIYAVQQVSSGSIDLSDRTQNQAASLEETAASLEEITATIKSNTDAAQSAEQQVHHTQAKSRQGTEVVSKAQAAMQAITESSHKISEIIVLIDSIAFQTNLLALNAAVEAARAGEHGRGFAVVAGEVRSLAQKSAEAAGSIKSLIETSVQQVEAGEKLVTATGNTLAEIDQSIIEVTQMIESISQASGQQQHGIEQINHAVAGIDGITQQNAALAEETSSAATQMTNDANEMQNALNFFKNNGNKQLN